MRRYGDRLRGNVARNLRARSVSKKKDGNQQHNRSHEEHFPRRFGPILRERTEFYRPVFQGGPMGTAPRAEPSLRGHARVANKTDSAILRTSANCGLSFATLNQRENRQLV